MRQIIIRIALFFLIVSYIIDPTGDFFQLKYISTIIAFLIFGINFILEKPKSVLYRYQLIYIVLFCLIMPLYGLSISLLYSDLNNFVDTSYIGFSISLLLLLPIVLIKNEIYLKMLITSLRLLSIIILVILISFLADGDQIGLANFFVVHNSMLMGFREYGGIPTYYIYFTASPLLIILIVNDSCNLIKKKSIKNILLFITSVISIFITGTRFNMLIAILVFPITFFLLNLNIKYILASLSLLIIVSIIIFNNPITSSFFSATEDSNSVKIGYLETYWNIFSQNPFFLLLGQGFNAHDWSMIFKNLLIKSNNEGTKTELTYIEMFRVFGIIIGLVLNLMLFIMPILIYKKYKKFNFISISLIVYLLSSSINPYIFSTNGVLFFLFFLVSINGNIETRRKILNNNL